MDSASPKPGYHYDLLGHPLAAWDAHPECRSCLHQKGIFCTRNSPCSTCQSWSPSQWKAWEAAELCSIQKRLRRQCKSAHKAADRSVSLLMVQDRAAVLPSQAQLPKAGPAQLQSSVLMPTPTRLPYRRVMAPVYSATGMDSGWSPFRISAWARQDWTPGLLQY